MLPAGTVCVANVVRYNSPAYPLGGGVRARVRAKVRESKGASKGESKGEGWVRIVQQPGVPPGWWA